MKSDELGWHKRWYSILSASVASGDATPHSISNSEVKAILHSVLSGAWTSQCGNDWRGACSWVDS